jgi:thiol-disulfide isomerase/thioredoxin
MSSLKIIVMLSAVLILIACASTQSGKEPRIEGGRLVFSLPDLEGEYVSSQDARFTGKVLLVSLWGSWCTPCVSEIPTFNDLQNRLGDDGLEIVAIAFEKETDVTRRRSQLAELTTKHEINYQVLDGGSTSDFSMALPMVDDVEGLPVEILVNRSGNVVEANHGYGYSEEWAHKLEERLINLLAD